ncbi:arabinofuranosyltransferase [Spirillospora sp. NPDC047279]|uniref:arabinofuranosyltransferase n=1 Tax=Spirillospora sp. NPDC047279 TaxID=3155478 RepID=UPI0033EF180B
MLLAPAPESPAASSDAAGGVRRRFRPPAAPSLWAVLVYLAVLPAAFWTPAAIGIDPFHLRGAMLPVAAGAAGLAAVALLLRRVRAGVLSGVAAGLFAGWVAFTMRSALNGAAYGFFGLGGDHGRMSTMVMRHTVVLGSADGIVEAAPSEYPPLYPWLIGRAGVLLDVPAWRLLGAAEALTCSAAVIVAFVLWRRLVPGPVALALAVVSLVVFRRPDKAFEVMALMAFVPWVLAAFTRPGGRRPLHWAAAGLVGGLMVLLYQGYLMFGALGVVAIIAVTWWRVDGRRAYMRDLLLMVATAAVVASWYLVPYVARMATHGLQMTDVFQSERLLATPLPFLEMTFLGVLQLTGLIGAVWFRRTVPWAEPMLFLLVSAYVYRFTLLLGFVVNGHTKVLHYTNELIETILVLAAVLTIVHVAPMAARRLASMPPARLPALALSVLVAWAGFTLWETWMPGAPATGGYGGDYRPAVNTRPNAATRAFTEPLPGGGYARHAPKEGRIRWFPAGPIVDRTRSVLGPGARPVTLSADERFFGVVPWPGYVGVDRSAAGSTTRWYARVRELRRLSRITDPARFAAETERTAFGPVDVFALRQNGPDWTWTAFDHRTRLTFSQRQFDPAAFQVFTDLPGDVVLAVRRP